MNSNAANRKKSHLEMKELMKKGDLSAALSEGVRASQAFGPHVGLACDIAACQYELGLFQASMNTSLQIKKAYFENHDLLSTESKYRTALFLAKLFEEQAEITEALTFLQEAQKYISDRSDLSFVGVQELRILSYLGISKDLSSKYASVSGFIKNENDLKIEVHHGLMWAEWSLFGFKHSLQRWELLKKAELNSLDRRLVARDFLEICLLSGVPDNTAAQEAANILSQSELLSFDRFLLDLFNKKEKSGEYLDCFDLSAMQRLRILLIEMKMEKDEIQIVELNKKYLFLLQGLSKASKNLLAALVGDFSKNQKITLTLSEDRRALRVADKPVEITKIQGKLIASFVEIKKISLEDVAHFIWEEDLNDSHYDRLRMIVYKLNKQLQEVTGISNCIEIGKNGLVLSKGILVT